MQHFLLIILAVSLAFMFLVRLFPRFFYRVFKFISGLLIVGMALSLIAAWCHWINYGDMINAMLLFGVPLKIINRIL